MVQHPGGSTGATPASEGPRDGAVPNQGVAELAPSGVPAPGELDAAVDRHPPGDPGPVSAGGSTSAADSGPTPREAPRHARAPVLQGGVLQPHGQPQGEHRPG